MMTDIKRRSFKSVFKKGISFVADFLVRLRLLPCRIIMHVDGGICSQMHFFLIGTVISQKYACKITYDLSWFKKFGKDIDGIQSRNFDLLKLFPYLNIRQENTGLIRRIYIMSFYRLSRYDSNTSAEGNQFAPPCFIDGYFKDTDLLYSRWFHNIYKINADLLPSDNIEYRNMIENNASNGATCAVHIRRGDLAKENPIYGSPCTIEYFIKSFKIMSEENKDMSFFIFSDEPDWVRYNILPELSDYVITMVDINDSDRGWCDLILMSLCRNQITSQGSMGKYASLLRKDTDKNGLVILPDNKFSIEWENRFDRTLIMKNNIKQL